MRDIHPTKLIKSEVFVKEPVNRICKYFENLDIDKIVVTGRGTGKSVLLEQMKNISVGTESPLFLMKFDLAMFSSNLEKNSIYTDTLLKHFCEEQFTFQLLWYIEENYEYTYRAHFTKYSDVIQKFHEKTIQYINDSVFEKQKPLEKFLGTHELSEEILDLFKKYCYTKKIKLGIDRFDWIPSERMQHILSQYFSLFSNCIITVDDETLPDEWYKTYFKDNSSLYSFYHYSIDYGKDINVMREILKRRIKNYNHYYAFNENFKAFEPFPENFFTDEIVDFIISKTNGNLSMIIGILKNLVNEWQWSERICLCDIENAFKECENNRLALKKIDANPPKLYL